MSKLLNRSDITLIGHPFAPIGMGEHVRCSFRSFRSVGASPGILDIYGLNTPEPDAKDEFFSYLKKSKSKVNIFHINGNEVEQALSTLAYLPGSEEGYNVIYPAWELARYPDCWARELERFDEVWAPSRFIEESLLKVVKQPVIHMPLACEVIITYFLDRRYFGIPENKFTYLFFFDIRSYVSRKNPDAVLRAFKILLKRKQFSGCILIVKINGADVAPKAYNALKERISEYGDNVLLINKTLTDTEVKNLIRVTDCFVSLHRSEGYGRGIAEAMYLGKPVICTGYSGNMDFTTTEETLLVDYKLIPVLKDEYPHWENQHWADPDVEQASWFMEKIFENRNFAYTLGYKASLKIRTEFGFRSTGVKYLERLKKLNKSIL